MQSWAKNNKIKLGESEEDEEWEQQHYINATYREKTVYSIQ